MKKSLRSFGIILVVCGLIFFLIGVLTVKNSRGSEYTFVASNGAETVIMDSGYTGDDGDGMKIGRFFKVSGIVISVGGGIIILTSLGNRIDDDSYM